jgi:hypothetical protein
MTTTQKSGLAAVLAALTGKQPAGDAISRADHMTAIEAAATQAFAAGETSAKTLMSTEGATAERTRIKGIMGGDSAKGRESLAAHFAYDTDMSVEAANAALAAAPKAEAGKGVSRLDVLMPGNSPQLKEPGPHADSPEAKVGASLDAGVDNMLKARGLVPR